MTDPHVYKSDELRSKDYNEAANKDQADRLRWLQKNR
jgi:hypothetical protein